MRKPFEITEPTCISFSGGRTSAFMLYKVLEAHNMSLPDEAVVCFANTGKEDEATLKFVHDCETHWNVKIMWVEYTPDKPGFKVVDFETASRNGEPFDALTTKKSYLPNPVARFCSEELKGRAITKATGLESDQTMVGVRADEQRRIAKLRQRGLLLPLVDAGVSKDDVRAFWKASAFDLVLEERGGITNLGNCDLCFMKGGAQLQSIIQHEPHRAVWWAEQEQKIGGTFRSDRASYTEMQKFGENQKDLFGTEETIPCFCGD